MYYAELEFLKGFLNEVMVLLFVKTVLKQNITKKKIVLIGFVYGLIAVFLPIFPLACKVVRYTLCFILLPILCLDKRLVTYLFAISIELFFSYFILPIPISLCVSISLGCFSRFPKKKIKSNGNYYECALSTEGKTVRTVAFFDSGNRVFGENGEPVVWADGKVYNKLPGEESEVFYSTLNGNNVAPCKEGRVVVFGNGKTYRYEAKIACSPKKINRYGVILHGDMVGGI